MRELILIRTHFYNEAVGALYDYFANSSGRHVAFVCDETSNPVNVGPGKAKIGINKDYITSLGLYAPRQFGWLCGDYFLYAGQKAFPDYDRYWLIESDVRFCLGEARELFGSFQDDDSDIFAFHVFKSSGNWYWHSPMAYFSNDVYACLFPVVGISERALATAYRDRVQMSATFDSIVPKEEKRRWPNDESFLMTTLINHGFKFRNINSKLKSFTSPATFNVGLPKSHERLRYQERDGMIYHPVHSGQNFVNKANSWLTNYINGKASPEKVVQMFGEAFLADLSFEASAEQLSDFKARLDNYTT